MLAGWGPSSHIDKPQMRAGGGGGGGGGGGAGGVQTLHITVTHIQTAYQRGLEAMMSSGGCKYSVVSECWMQVTSGTVNTFQLFVDEADPP